MSPDPKPAPRTKKTPKPILQRRLRARVVRITCTSRGCKRPPTAGTLCVTHAKARADAAWGLAVRTGKCEMQDFPHRCGGVNQACHGFSRGYLGTRYLLDNGFSGCAAINFIAEVKPLEWDSYLRVRWGVEKYEELRALALGFGKKGERVDYEAVIAALGTSANTRDEES